MDRIRVRATSLALGCLALGLTLGAGPAGAGRGATADDGALSLDGVWLRVDEESDDLEVLVTDALAGNAGAPRGGAAWNPGGQPAAPGSRWGGLPRGQRPSLGSLEERAAERFAEMARALDLLEIESAGEQVVVRDATRESRILFLDGRVVADGLGGRTQAQLEGQTLVVEARNEAGGRLDRFELSPAGDRLTVTTELDGEAAPGRSRNLSFRVVYARVETARLSPEPEPLVPETVTRARGDTEVARREGDPPTVRARLVGSDASEPEVEDEGDSVRAGDVRADDVRADPVRAEEGEAGRPSAATAIRLLPPEVLPGQLVRGRLTVEALTIDPAIERVEFLLDDEPVERRTLPPWEARILLADPPREQVVEAVAYAGGGRRVGSDRLVLNRLDPAFRIRIVGFDGTVGAGDLAIEAEVSVPRKAELASVAFFLNQRLFTSLGAEDLPASPGGPVRGSVTVADAGPQDYVRVAARLRDGREIEDVQVLQGADFAEELDVQLVQLQVLAVDRAGRPVRDLAPSEFTVREEREPRTIDRVYPSRDVALVLGLAIDSSGSMGPLWGATRRAAEEFLADTLTDRDKAFLVDFDSQLRLLQGVTGDKDRLYRALDRLQPQGNTALYDSILFSLLQYQGEPGRRALIVITDGYDSASEADPQRAIELGRRLGVPVYVIAMRSPQAGGGWQPQRQGFGQGGGGFASESVARNQLRLITDPTGGRLFQAASVEQVENAFGQIQDELRNQYVLTYYSQRAPDEPLAPSVEVERKGVKVKTAIPFDLAN